MAHKKVREIQSRNPGFSHPTRSLEHKNQGFVRQNFGHTKRAWIPEYLVFRHGQKWLLENILLVKDGPYQLPMRPVKNSRAVCSHTTSTYCS